MAAASPLLLAPSLARMFETWTLTVLAEMKSSPSDSCVTVAVGHEPQHLEFSRGQVPCRAYWPRSVRTGAGQRDPRPAGQQADVIGQPPGAEVAGDGRSHRQCRCRRAAVRLRGECRLGHPVQHGAQRERLAKLIPGFRRLLPAQELPRTSVLVPAGPCQLSGQRQAERGLHRAGDV